MTGSTQPPRQPVSPGAGDPPAVGRLRPLATLIDATVDDRVYGQVRGVYLDENDVLRVIGVTPAELTALGPALAALAAAKVAKP